jgi:hypothetical protein
MAKKICLTLMANSLTAKVHQEEYKKIKYKDMEYHHCTSLDELLNMAEEKNIGGIMVDPLFISVLAKKKSGHIIDMTAEHERLILIMKKFGERTQLVHHTVPNDNSISNWEIVARRNFAHLFSSKVRHFLQPH